MWFNVDDHLHSTPELFEIPRRFRAAAVGVWTLCGSWLSQHCADYVPDEVVRDFGGTAEIRGWLVRAGLWTETDRGIAYTSRGCRVPNAQAVQQSRAATTERVRKHRANKQKGPDQQVEADVTPLHPPGQGALLTLHDGIGIGNGVGSLTKPTSSKAVVTFRGTSPGGPLAEARVLVQQALVGLSYFGRKQRKALEDKTLELLGDGAKPEDLAEALRIWVQTDDVYPGHLSHMYTELMKRRSGVTRSRSASNIDHSFQQLADLDRRYAAESESGSSI